MTILHRHRDPADALAIEALAAENLALREALADLGADHVLLRLTFSRLLRALDTQNHELREALDGRAQCREAA